jgi:hypothetical protein
MNVCAPLAGTAMEYWHVTSIHTNKITAVVEPHFLDALHVRRLLATQTGVEIAVTIMSDSYSAMNALTTSINLSVLPLAYTITSMPLSTVLVSGRGHVNTVQEGFGVDSVVFSSTTNRWEIDCRYHTDISNTITSPFLSKIGPSPYSDAVLAKFEISTFPCQRNSSICCLNDYSSNYVNGIFATNITEKIGACGPVIQAADTEDVLDASATAVYVTDLMHNYPNSRVDSSQSAGTMHMSLAANDVTDSFS